MSIEIISMGRTMFLLFSLIIELRQSKMNLKLVLDVMKNACF